MGEGGAVLILEELESALARGAHIYCEVAGFASRGNAYHMTGLRPDGCEMSEAILDAMAPGGPQAARTSTTSTRTARAPSRTTGTRRRRSRTTLGEHAYKVPISSIKSMVGHSLGGDRRDRDRRLRAGDRPGVVPPTANWENPDPECDLDYMPKVAVRKHVDVALSTGSGFGGFQSAMIFSVPDERRERWRAMSPTSPDQQTAAP